MAAASTSSWTRGGAKRWVFLFRWEGRLREMGLGGLTSVSLTKARERAAAAREQVADGVNPITHRRTGSAPVTVRWSRR